MQCFRLNRYPVNSNNQYLIIHSILYRQASVLLVSQRAAKSDCICKSFKSSLFCKLVDCTKNLCMDDFSFKHSAILVINCLEGTSTFSLIKLIMNSCEKEPGILRVADYFDTHIFVIRATSYDVE